MPNDIESQINQFANEATNCLIMTKKRWWLEDGKLRWSNAEYREPPIGLE